MKKDNERWRRDNLIKVVSKECKGEMKAIIESKKDVEKRLKDFYKENIDGISNCIEWIECNNLYDIEEMLQHGNGFDKREEVKVLHCFADFIVSDASKLLLTYRKINYIEDDIQLMLKNRCPALMFSTWAAYIDFLKNNNILSDKYHLKKIDNT